MSLCGWVEGKQCLSLVWVLPTAPANAQLGISDVFSFSCNEPKKFSDVCIFYVYPYLPPCWSLVMNISHAVGVATHPFGVRLE